MPADNVFRVIMRAICSPLEGSVQRKMKDIGEPRVKSG